MSQGSIWQYLAIKNRSICILLVVVCIMRYMLNAPDPKTLEADDLFNEAVKIVAQYDGVSSALLQRRLSIGYARAARLMDQLEAAKVVSSSEGAGKPREVLIQNADEFLANSVKTNNNEPDDAFKISGNYRLPQAIKLSKVSTSPREQLADAIKTKNFLDLKDDHPLILGYDEKEDLQVSTLSQVGNLIVTGNPQSKKENWIDTVLTSLLLNSPPSELRLILIDLSHYLDLYNGIPHLLSKVITDFDRGVSAFRWLSYEANRREKIMAEAGVRNLDSYNQLAKSGTKPSTLTPPPDYLPKILVVAFCNWFDKEVIDSAAWLTNNCLNVGIHLFLVANRLGDKSLSPDLKANIPNRAVFTVTSASDSQLAGVSGAEKLNDGEMFYKIGNQKPIKLTTIFTPEVNVKEVVEAIKSPST